MIKKRLINLLAHAKKYVYLAVFWQWIALLAQTAVVFCIARLLEQTIGGTLSQRSVITALAVCAAALLVRSITTVLATRCTFLASKDVKTVLRKQLFAKLLRLGTAYRENVATSEIVQMAAEGVEQLETYFGSYLPQFFYSLLAPLTLFVILAPLSIKAAIVLLVCVPLIPLSIVAVQKVAKRLLKKYLTVYTGLGDNFLENLQGLTTLKIYKADADKSVQMDKDAEYFRQITMKVLTMQLNSITVMDILAYGGAAAGIITALLEFSAGLISFSTAIIILLLAAEFFIPLRLLGSFFHIAMNGMAASDKIFFILDLPEPQPALNAVSALDSVEHTSITIDNLSFSYDEKRPIIKNAGVSIPHGSFVALVGESGSGKSTIAALLSGKHKNYTGQISFGSIPLSQIPESVLMKHVTVIKHNSYLFKGTVADNLRMAKPDATDEQMIAVLNKVNLYGFLAAQKGLDTELVEKAANFSGGQCQRLALARALLFDSPIYIFDEATSNIDPESEEMIMQVIYGLKRTKTIILISHRLANTTDCDCIYFLKNGSITEKGSFSELLARKGDYYTLYESQKTLEMYGERKA